jgi:hypothetical protein
MKGRRKGVAKFLRFLLCDIPERGCGNAVDAMNYTATPVRI